MNELEYTFQLPLNAGNSARDKHPTNENALADVNYAVGGRSSSEQSKNS